MKNIDLISDEDANIHVDTEKELGWVSLSAEGNGYKSEMMIKNEDFLRIADELRKEVPEAE